MYAPFFGLTQDPFSIAPDPRYLFMSGRHREALAHLLFGLEGGGGFVLLTGDIGTGKTTVCRCFLEQVPAHCHVAYIFNPKLSVAELLQSICDEFHIAAPAQGTVKDYLDPLNAFLLQAHAAGRNCVLIIDEAQNLSADVLEQLRLLTNLETHSRKLLQIILIGQPELRAMLASPQLEQLAQRVIARYHLQALSAAETGAYLRHRMGVAGLPGALPFDGRALARIHVLSGGVPRRINLLCGRALLGAFAKGQRGVTRELVDGAAREVFDAPPSAGSGPWWTRPPILLATGLAVGAAVLAVALFTLDAGRGFTGKPIALAAVQTQAAAPAAAAPQVKPPPAGLPPLLASEAAAWRELAPLWRLSLGEGDPCAQAAGQRLRCWRRPVSLALVRELDRPGILTLHPLDGPPAYALLLGWSGDHALLRARGVDQLVPLAALVGVWRGVFATYWRTPPGDVTELAPGGAGPAVDWLAQSLSRVDGAASASPSASPSASANPPKLDAALQSRVAAFQARHGLEPDGRVGPLTLMQLQRAVGVDEPRLRADLP